MTKPHVGARFGAGLDGRGVTEELTQLLAILCEPASANPWLVDWLWGESLLCPELLHMHGDHNLVQPSMAGISVGSCLRLWLHV